MGTSGTPMSLSELGELITQIRLQEYNRKLEDSHRIKYISPNIDSRVRMCFSIVLITYDGNAAVFSVEDSEKSLYDRCIEWMKRGDCGK